MKRGQGGFEYILLLSGVLLSVILVVVILKGVIITPAFSNVNGTATILSNLTNTSNVNLSIYEGSGGTQSSGGGSSTCTSYTQCSSGQICVSEACQACGLNSDCSVYGNNYVCSSGQCVQQSNPSTWLLVSLNNPENNSIENVNNYGFNFTPTGSDSSYNCSLYLNGLLVEFNSSTLNNTQTHFSYPSIGENSNDYWYVNCSNASLSNVSQTFYFTQSSTMNIFNLFNGSVSTTPNPGFNFSVSGPYSTYQCYVYMDGYSGSYYHAYNYTVLNNTPTTGLTYPYGSDIANGQHNYTIDCENSNNWINSSVMYFTQNMQLLIQDNNPLNNSVSTTPNPGFNFTVTGPYNGGTSSGYKCYIYLDGYTGNYNHAYNYSVLNNTPTTGLTYPYGSDIANGQHNYTINCTYIDSNIDTTYSKGINTLYNNTPTTNFQQAMQLLVTYLTPSNNSITNPPQPPLSVLINGPYASNYYCWIYLDGKTYPNYYAYNNSVLNNTLQTAFTYYNGAAIANGAHNSTAVCNYTDSNIDTNYAKGSQIISNVSSASYFNQSFIELIFPANNTSTSATTSNFTIQPLGPYSTYNCDLQIDGVDTSSLSTISNNTKSNFSNIGIGSGNHLWWVNCSNGSWNANSTSWNLKVILS